MNLVATLDWIERMIIDGEKLGMIRSQLIPFREQLEATQKDAKALAKLKKENSALKKAHSDFKRKCADTAEALKAQYSEAKSDTDKNHFDEIKALKAKHFQEVKHLEDQIKTYSLGNVRRFR